MLRMWKDYMEITGFLRDSIMRNEKEKAKGSAVSIYVSKYSLRRFQIQMY